MNDLRVFENTEFGQLEVYEIGGKPHFPATKCAEILGYEKPHNAVAMHCRYSLRQGVPHPQNPDKVLEINLIPEGDLYRLIVKAADQSRNHEIKEKAQRFECWVFDDVLPSIRKYGLYAKEEILGDPDLLISLAIELKNEREQRKRLETERLRLLPKADFHDAVSASSDNLTIQKAAKILGTGELRLFQFLRDQKVFMANNQPYQEYLDRGYFRVLLKSRRFDGEDHIYTQTVITAKGMPWLRKLLAEKAHLKVVGRDA